MFNVMPSIRNAGGFALPAQANLITHSNETSHVKTGNDLDQWSDLTGNANHWTPFSGTKPTVVNQKNGLDIVSFPTAGNEATLEQTQPALTTGDPSTLLIVCKGLASQSADSLYYFTSSGGVEYWYWADIQAYMGFGRNTRKFYNGLPSRTSGGWFIMIIRSEGFAGGDWECRVNGTAWTGNDVIPANANYTSPSGNWYIGGNTFGLSQSWQGEIAEVAVWDTYIDGGDLTALENGISAKWDIALGAI